MCKSLALPRSPRPLPGERLSGLGSPEVVDWIAKSERATLNDNLMDQDIGTVCNFFAPTHLERGPRLPKCPWFRKSGPPAAAIQAPS